MDLLLIIRNILYICWPTRQDVALLYLRLLQSDWWGIDNGRDAHYSCNVYQFEITVLHYINM